MGALDFASAFLPCATPPIKKRTTLKATVNGADYYRQAGRNFPAPPVFHYETDSPSSDGVDVFDRKPRQFFGFTGGAFHASRQGRARISSQSQIEIPPITRQARGDAPS
jgi:hypothetical protein